MLALILMILELTATCPLGPGVRYTPPVGWALVQVQTQGQISNCAPGEHPAPLMPYCTAMNYPRYAENTVTLRRTVHVGETVEAPTGCAMTMQGTEPKEEKP
jgi:hypothetical protein